MEKIKNAGGMVGGLLVLLVMISIPFLLLKGMAEISVWLLEWIPDIIGWATFGAIVLLPLAIIPASRGVAGNLYQMLSLVYLACLWFYAMAFTYLEWDFLGLVIGVMMAGIGVILTGGLAAVFAGEWTVLSNLGLMLFFVVVTNVLGSWLFDLAERRKRKAAIREKPTSVTIIQSGEEQRIP